jgi:hypothetical protein
MEGTRDPFIPVGRTRIVVVTLVAFLLLFELLDVRLRVQQGHGDWIVYWTAARQFPRVADPYLFPAPAGDYYIYPPLLALLMGPLGRLKPADAASVWYAINIAMLAGCYFEWRRIDRAVRDRPPPGWLLLTTVFLGALPITSSLQGGQMSVLILYCLLLGGRLIFFADGVVNWMAAGLVLALPAAIKLSPGLVGAVAVLQLLGAPAGGAISQPRRRALTLALSLAGGSILWFLVVPAMIAGWQRNLDLLRMFADHVVFARATLNDTAPTNQALVQAVRTWCGAIGAVLGTSIRSGFITAVTTALALAFGLPVALAMRRLIRSGTGLDHVVVFSLSAAASLFYSPITWHFHFALALPFVAAAPLYWIERGNVRAARRLTVSVAVVFLLQYVLNNLKLLAVPVLGPLFAVCVVGFAVGVFVLTPSRPRR